MSVYPEFYQLPPFFTLQPNLQTFEKQCQMWGDLLATFCKKEKIYDLNIQDEVFENKTINRRLSEEAFVAIKKQLVKYGRADALPGNGIRIYPVAKRELADAIIRYITDMGFYFPC